MNKFRKKLREFGMEKEFISWMKKSPRTGAFEVGDKVRIIEPYDGGGGVEYEAGKMGVVKELGSGLYNSLIHVNFGEEGSPWLFGRRFERI